METRGSDAISALRWGIGKYAWLFVLYIVALTAAIPAVFLRSSENYDAEALVIAQRLDMSMLALPRYGEAVFDNGEVARAVAAQLGDDGDFENIVPDRVSLVAEQDSIVLRVEGHDSAPDTAAELANVAAAAFINELNAPGEGVGAFTLQSAAVPPPEPTEPTAGPTVLLPVGLAGGLLLALAAVAIVVVVRRPVLEAGDAEQATGVAVLGTVTVPRTRRGRFPSGGDVVGVVPLCRRMLTLDTEAILVVSWRRGGGVGDQLAVSAASVLSRVCNVRLVASEELRRAASSLAGGSVAAEDDTTTSDGSTSLASDEVTGSSTSPRRSITLVRSADPLVLVGGWEAGTTLLLVPHGMSRRALRDAAAEHLGGGPAGLVMVRRSWRRAQRVSGPLANEPGSDDAAPGDPASAQAPEPSQRSTVPVER